LEYKELREVVQLYLPYSFALYFDIINWYDDDDDIDLKEL